MYRTGFLVKQTKNNSGRKDGTILIYIRNTYPTIIAGFTLLWIIMIFSSFSSTVYCKLKRKSLDNLFLIILMFLAIVVTFNPFQIILTNRSKK
jgi:hypothetical protein